MLGGRSGEVSKTSKNREILWLIGRFGTATNVDGVLFCDLFVHRSSVPNTLQCRDCIHSPYSLVLPCIFHSRYGLFYLSYLAEDRYNRNPSDIRTAASPLLFRHAVLRRVPIHIVTVSRPFVPRGAGHRRQALVCLH